MGFLCFGYGAMMRRIEHKLNLLLEKGDQMSKQMDDLTREVAETQGAVDSAIVLIQGLSDYLHANADDPVAIEKMANDLDAEQAKLAAAVAANPVPPVV